MKGWHLTDNHKYVSISENRNLTKRTEEKVGHSKEHEF